MWLIAVAVLISIYFLSRNTDTLSLTSGIKIEIELSRDLTGDIQIVSAEGKKPGDVNPVETTIILKNVSDTEKQILAKGDWQERVGALMEAAVPCEPWRQARYRPFRPAPTL